MNPVPGTFSRTAGTTGVLIRYALLPVLTVAATAGLRQVLSPWLGDSAPFSLFTLAVLAAAWWGGLGAGLLTTALAAAAGGFLFLAPGFDWQVSDPAGLARMALFLAIGGLVSLTVGAMRRANRRARERGEVLAVTLASIGDAVITTDAARRITFLNPQAERLTGWRQAEAAGRDLDAVFAIVNESTRQRVECPVRRVLETGHVTGLANYTVLIARDGGERPIDDSAAPIRDAAGGVLGVVLVFRDITQKREAARRLQESEAHLRAVFDSAAEGLYMVDADGRCSYLNAAGAAVLGYRPEELIGRPLHALIHHRRLDGSDYPAADCPVGRTIQEGVPARVEDEVFWRKDGTPVPVVYAANPVTAGGARAGAVVTFSDVSERRRAEEALRAKEARLRLATEVAGLGIWEWHIAEDRVRWENARLHEIFGLPRDAEPINAARFQSEFVHPDDAAFAQAIEHALGGDAPFHFLGRFRRADGALRWAEFNGRVARAGDGTPLRILGTAADVTARQRAAEDLRQSRDELEVRVAERTAELRREQAFLQAVLESIEDAVVACDQDGVLTLFNRASRNLHGLPEAPLPAADWAKHYNLYRPDGVTPLPQAEIPLFRALRGEHVRDAEMVIARKDGEARTLLASGQPLLGEAGEQLGAVVSMHDVTDRRRAEAARAELLREQALRRGEERLREFADTAPAMLWATEPDGRCSFLSRGWYEFTGQSASEGLGFGWLDAVHPDDRGAAGEAFLRANARGEAFALEHRLRRRDGTYRWVIDAGRPRLDADGGLLGHVCSVIDISERRASEEALRTAQERLAGTLAAAEVAPWVLDLATDRVSADRNLAALFGIDAQDAATGGPAETFLARIHPDDRPGVEAAIARAQADGGYFNSEYRVVHPDGTVVWLVSRGRVGIGADGRPQTLHGVTIDVSRQKRAEAEVRERELRYRLVADASNDAIWDWDLATDQVIWSESVRTSFGHAAVGPDAAWWVAHLHPEDAERVRHDLHAHLDHGPDVWQAEYRFQRADGSYAFVLDRGRVVRDAAGRAVRMVGAMLDLSERRRTEAALWAAEERFAFVRRSSGVGFWYCDLPFDVLEWDEQVKAHFHLPPDARVTIDTFYDRIHPDDREPTRRAIAQSIAERTAYDTTYRTVHAGTGAEKWVRAIGQTFYGPDGTPAHFDGVTVDVTDQKRAEQALQEADRRKDEFLATLAHELRNPLAPIRTGLQVLKLAPPGPVADDARDMMERQLGHMVRLIDDLLDVSRIRGGKVKLKRARVELRAVLDTAIEASRPAVAAGHHCLGVDLPDAPVWLDADLTRLAQVVSNVLTNAAKYTPEGGRITLTARREGGEAVIRVRDNGVGIPREMLDRVFEMFAQVQKTLDRAQGGLGIGLALARRLIEKHGGSIEADSAGPGQGSVFTLRVPVAEGVADEQDGDGHAPAPIGDDRILSAPGEGRVPGPAGESRAQPAGGDPTTPALGPPALGEDLDASVNGGGLAPSTPNDDRISAASAGDGQTPPAEGQTAPPGGGPPGRRVLVVDDNRDAAESLAMMLQLYGHQVRTAYDGPQALDAARASPPELVLLDIGLPDMNGYEVARAFRAEPALRATVLVALTGWGSEADKQRSREAGFDLHLTKPVEFAAVEAVLARLESGGFRGG